MVRPLSIHVINEPFSPIPLAIGLFVSITLLVSLCAKHARRVSREDVSKTSEPNTPRSPLPSAKKMITAISQKAMMINGKKKVPPESDTGFGMKEAESGLWQKAIMMGDKCRPPEFSGVIYYDYSGNRIPEMPKSPRVAPMSPLRSFAYHVEQNDEYIYK